MSLISLWNGLQYDIKKVWRFVFASSNSLASRIANSTDKTIAPTPQYAYSTALTADVYATDVGAIANHLRGISNFARI